MRGKRSIAQRARNNRIVRIVSIEAVDDHGTRRLHERNPKLNLRRSDRAEVAHYSAWRNRKRQAVGAEPALGFLIRVRQPESREPGCRRVYGGASCLYVNDQWTCRQTMINSRCWSDRKSKRLKPSHVSESRMPS